MRSVVRFLLSCFVLLSAATVAHAQNGIQPEGQSAHVKARLIAQSVTVAKDSEVLVVLDYTAEPGWHTYWVNPGDAGLATSLNWNLPDGISVTETRWPAPEILPTLGLTSYGYAGRTQAVITLRNGSAFKDGDALPVRAKVDFLVCKDVCIPESLEVALDLKVGQARPAPDSKTVDKAVAALPAPLPLLRPTVALSAGQVALGFPADGMAALLNHAKGAYFFPEQANLIPAGAPQAVDIGAAGFTLRTKAAGEALPEGDLTGVLVMGNGQAWRIALTRAPLAAALHGGTTGSATDTGAAGGTLLAVAFAFLGGLILNLMPCVFPVLSMKLLGLSRAGHQGRAAQIESLVYGAGAILSFVALALILELAQALGASLGWGFQLQSPWVTAGLAVVMLLVALNMSGLFEVGASLQGLGAGALDQKRPLLSAFLTGVLAVVVAAPCTAPFMATAIGVALAQGGLTALVIFTALGIGFALPFVALTFLITLVPGLATRLPKPGPWMDRLKQGLALLMYAAAAWLVWVFAQQVQSVVILVFALVLIAAAIVFAKKPPFTATPFLSPAVLAIGVFLAIFAAAQPPATKTSATPSNLSAHRNFSTAALSELRQKGTPVFVDLTAAWCVTCKVNERLVLTTPEFEKALADTGTVYMVGDWTNQDAEISRYLKLYGRSGVPLYVYYGPAQAPAVILPQMLDTAAVVKMVRGG